LARSLQKFFLLEVSRSQATWLFEKKTTLKREIVVVLFFEINLGITRFDP